MIRDIHPGSGFWFFSHPGSRIQGIKRHRIPDPDSQHWKNVWTPPACAFFLFLFILWLDSWRIQHLGWSMELRRRKPWVKIGVHCFLHIFWMSRMIMFIGIRWKIKDFYFIFVFIFIFISFLGKRGLARLPLQKILRLPHQEMLIHKFWACAFLSFCGRNCFWSLVFFVCVICGGMSLCLNSGLFARSDLVFDLRSLVLWSELVF